MRNVARASRPAEQPTQADTAGRDGYVYVSSAVNCTEKAVPGRGGFWWDREWWNAPTPTRPVTLDAL